MINMMWSKISPVSELRGIRDLEYVILYIVNICICRSIEDCGAQGDTLGVTEPPTRAIPV